MNFKINQKVNKKSEKKINIKMHNYTVYTNSFNQNVERTNEIHNISSPCWV